MTTTDSVESRGHGRPHGLQRFVHAGVVAGLAATLMCSGNVRADEPRHDTVAYGHYDAAVQARIDGNRQLALELLRKAWALEHSALIAAKLAQTELELGLYRDAIEHFEFYLQQPEPRPEDRATVARLLAEAKNKIVVLDIRVDTPGAEILVDRAVVGVAPLSQEIRLDPGKRIVEARKEGCTFKSLPVELAPGSKQNLFFACERRPEPPPPKVVEKTPTWKYWAVPLVGALGVAGVAGGLRMAIPDIRKSMQLSDEAMQRGNALVPLTPSHQTVCGDDRPAANTDECMVILSKLSASDQAWNDAGRGFAIAGAGLALGIGAIVMAAMPAQQRSQARVVPIIKSSEGGVLVTMSF